MNVASKRSFVAFLFIALFAVPVATTWAESSGEVTRIAAEARLRGDARRGAKLFHQSAAACAKCHLQGEASPLGPDLTTVDPKASDEYFVEAILEPSKTIRKGYETVRVLTENGKVFTGMVARETDQFLMLRDASDLQREIRIDKDSIEVVKKSDQSMMPKGLAESLRQPRDLLDLVRYLMEIARGGESRALELLPNPDELVVRDDTLNLDHAGIIKNLTEDDLKIGERIYRSHCVNCHGRDGNTPTLPTARAFGKQPMKFGADPFRMVQTLTNGAGLMAAMQNLSPRERYQVAHYIRETFMKAANPVYEPVTEAYLAALPEGTESGDRAESGDRDYGLALGSQIGNDINSALTLRPIDNVTVSYDLHRLKFAGVWENGFLDLSETQHYKQRGERMPKIDGDPIAGLDEWTWELGGSFERSAESKPTRGPVSDDLMRFRGYYVSDDRTVLNYDIAGRQVLETVDVSRINANADRNAAVLHQTLRVEPGEEALRVSIANTKRLKRSSVRISEDNGSAMISWAGTVGKKSPSFANKALHVLAAETSQELDLGTIGRTVVAKFRTTAGGTLIASAPQKGHWRPNGKTLFIRGGKLVFDIGWVGAIQSRSSVNDGRWHIACLVVDDESTRLYVDGKLEAERVEFRRPANSSHVIKIGATADDFGGDFQGNLGWIGIIDDALDGEALAGANADEESLDTWKEDHGFLFDWQADAETELTAKPPSRHRMAAALSGDLEGVTLEEADGRVVLKIPASDRAKVIRVSRCSVSEDSSDVDVVGFTRTASRDSELRDPIGWTRGGSVRWPEELVVRGQLGESVNGYALDTIPVPFENPWNAWMRTSAIDFLEDGRAVVSTHGGDIYLVSGVDESLSHVTWKRFASGLFEPFGVRVIDGKIYVTCRDGLKRLHDFNGDDEADYIESFWNDDDVSCKFHAYNFDLQTDDEGNFYLAKAGQYTNHHRPGSIMRIPPEGGSAEVVAWGIRTPNGMGRLADGRFTVSDNQGPWMPAGKISIAEAGDFLGNMPINDEQREWLKARHGGSLPETFDEPMIWMPQELDNSCGGQVWADNSKLGPISGRLLHSSFGKGWLYYLSMQEINGKTQASMVALPHQWDAGVMRLRIHPIDGQVYGTGLSGWQGPSGGRDGCLQRLRYTGDPVLMVESFSVVEGGVELKFS
ncbi:MAG: DUF6797 domain-containing protein, partial [Planctomycetota bacterium]